jgi:hypothetical protein
MNQCQHKDAKMVHVDVSERTGTGVICTYHCPRCQQQWRVYYQYADATMREIVSKGEIRRNRLIREQSAQW